MEKLKLNFNKEKLKLNLTPAPALNFSALSNGDIQRIVAAVEMALQGDFDLLNQNIDTHTTDTDIHITSDERTLWNTVSEKAKQSDVNELRNEMSGLDVNITAHSSDEEMHITADERVSWNDNVEQTKQNQEAISNIEGHIGDIYDMVHVNKDNIEVLQAQMGDIDTTLENIIDIQNTLMGGGTV